MKKTIRKVILATIICILIFTAYNSTLASIDVPSGMGSIYPGGDPIVDKIGGQILWIAQVILYTVAVLAVIFAGLKYLNAAPEAKAEFKKRLIYITAGAVILFAAGAIVTLIGDLAGNI